MAGKTVRVFLDSNIILSGLLSDTGAPGIILDILSLNLPFLAGLTGRYNIIEIERNIKKKLPRAFPVYEEYFSKINLSIVPLPSADEIRKYAGHVIAKDVPVLVSAVKGKADFLLTGDKKHFQKLKSAGTYPFTVASRSEFLDAILPAIVAGWSMDIKR